MQTPSSTQNAKAKKAAFRHAAHSLTKPQDRYNQFETHPLFQRRQSKFDRNRGQYFGWLRTALPELLSTVSHSITRALPVKKKASDPDSPILGLRETEELRKLYFSGGERKRLLALFKEMAGPKRNTVSFRAFARYFRFSPDVWTMRLFELINYQITGTVTFLEFAAFVVKYLIIDRALTEEFCFRLLSRRGVTFMPEFSILDLSDFVTIVSFRYKEFSTLPVQRKVALDVFAFVDSDNDGGVSIHELREFSAKNPVLVRMAHMLLSHMRKVIFGLDFWVEKSRRWKLYQMSLASRPALARANLENETFAEHVLLDPVVDSLGVPLTNAELLLLMEIAEATSQDHVAHSPHHAHRQGSPHHGQQHPSSPHSPAGRSSHAPSVLPSMLSQQGSMASLVSDPSLVHQSSSIARDNSLVGAEHASLDSASLKGMSHPPSLVQPRGDSFVDNSSLISRDSSSIVLDDPTGAQQGLAMLLTTGMTTAAILARQKDYRTCSAWSQSFSMQQVVQNATFAADFPEIVRLRQEKRREKRQQEQLRREAILTMRKEAYTKLVKVCSDFLGHKRDLRRAFDQWLRLASKQSMAEVNAPHRSYLHRLASAGSALLVGDGGDSVSWRYDGITQVDDADSLSLNSQSLEGSSVAGDDVGNPDFSTIPSPHVQQQPHPLPPSSDKPGTRFTFPEIVDGPINQDALVEPALILPPLHASTPTTTRLLKSAQQASYTSSPRTLLQQSLEQRPAPLSLPSIQGPAASSSGSSNNTPRSSARSSQSTQHRTQASRSIVHETIVRDVRMAHEEMVAASYDVYVDQYLATNFAASFVKGHGVALPGRPSKGSASAHGVHGHPGGGLAVREGIRKLPVQMHPQVVGLSGSSSDSKIGVLRTHALQAHRMLDDLEREELDDSIADGYGS